MDPVCVGIDLGTTNSCLAAFENGKPMVVPNDLGDATTPSLVSVLPDGQVPQVDLPKDESPPAGAAMIEIEMPQSVREVLGMEPVAQIRTCERYGLPWDGTTALCDSCSEGT